MNKANKIELDKLGRVIIHDKAIWTLSVARRDWVESCQRLIPIVDTVVQACCRHSLIPIALVIINET